MDRDPGDTMSPSQFHRRQEVLVERVHTAEAQEPGEVESASGVFHVSAERDQGLEVEEAATRNALVDAHEVLRHHASGAEVEVPDLAVAHLALGETDGQPACVEQRMWLGGPEPVPDGGVAE